MTKDATAGPAPKIAYYCRACPTVFYDALSSNAHHDETGHHQTWRESDRYVAPSSIVDFRPMALAKRKEYEQHPASEDQTTGVLACSAALRLAEVCEYPGSDINAIHRAADRLMELHGRAEQLERYLETERVKVRGLRAQVEAMAEVCTCLKPECGKAHGSLRRGWRGDVAHAATPSPE